MSTKSIKGTKTEKCLADAYMSESAAYSRYTYYAQQAEKENYYPISEVFKDTAANELHHGKIFFKYLEGGKCPVTLDIDAGVIGDTASNLQTAANEEEAEGVEQYIQAAKIAREEGFDDIADHFEAIAKIEAHHRERFLAYLKQVQDGTVWKRDHVIKWKCLVCGYIYEGTEPPVKCPACNHPQCHYMALDME
ncbi:MAG: rubrerythrin family protein [Duncaniella sp.]|nr:rubrerythrin family protein [Duncaniella sp.]